MSAPRRVILFDGDQFLYRACAASERDVRWDDENHVLSSNEEETWETLSGSVRNTLEFVGGGEAVLCLSECGEHDFRKDLAGGDYKAHRADKRKPLCYAEMKQRMRDYYTCVSFRGLEADDVMGILATKPGDYERLIVSRDKDMKTIPGKLWNGQQFLTISEAEADYWHLYQTLVGDAADGYKGCPGVGPKRAEKLLTTGPYWPRVVAAYEAAGLTEADALLQARLARILRWSDWDTEKKEPKLWTP